MIAAVCVDERNGTLFRSRRQSQDRAQREDLLSLCPGPLWMDGYSARLFTGAEARLRVSEDYLDRAGTGEWCFVEGRSLAPFADRLEAVVLYRWNRAYPADAHLDIDLSGYILAERRDLAGTSHDTITRETYRRPAPPPEEDRPPEEPEPPAPPPEEPLLGPAFEWPSFP